MLIHEFFTTVYRPHRLRGRSENSTRLYLLCIKQFGLTLGRNPVLADLTEQNILAHLDRRSGVAPATRNKELSELTAIWRFAVQRGMHTGWPCVQKEPEPERDPIAWMPGELHAIFAAIKRMDGEIEGISCYRFWNSMLRTILDSGERIGAIRFAKWSWLQSDWLMVPAEARKRQTRDRRYRLSPTTVAAIAAVREQSKDSLLIWPWPYCNTYLWQKFAKILDDAGLPTTRKHKFHSLRKTTASVAYAAGMDPQDCLDHSDRRTTQKYLDPRFIRKQQACDVLAEYLAKPQLDNPLEVKRTG